MSDWKKARKLESWCEGCERSFDWETMKRAGTIGSYGFRIELCPDCLKKLGGDPPDSDDYKTSEVI